jgi:penicillin-binding protein 1A
MKEMYQRRPEPPDWPRPETLVAREVDAATGMLAGPFCTGGSYTEWFIPGTEPYQECGWGAPGDAYGTPADTFGAPPPGGTPRPRQQTPRDSVYNPFRLPPPAPDGTPRP